MNASASMRSAYVRKSMAIMQQPSMQTTTTAATLQARPIDSEKLRNFKALDYLEHREQCNQEKNNPGPCYDLQAPASSFEFEPQDTGGIQAARVLKIFTTFPYRDPIYLVAIVFFIGSVVLVINACFDLQPRDRPSPSLESRGEEMAAGSIGEVDEPLSIPVTILIGSILFFAAGIFDTFGALNADHGTFEVDEVESGVARFKPALLGTPQFKWIPDWKKFMDLTISNVAFQAGLIVLFGGVIFMFAGIVDFPGVIPENSPFFNLVVIGPQIIHGLLFLIANGMLALSGQRKWWQPKLEDPDWVGAILNAVGGFGFMLAGFLLVRKNEVGSAVSDLIGSLMFTVGSLVRLYVVMEVY